MNKYLKIYLSIYSFIIMVASLLYIGGLFDKLDLPNFLNNLYMFVHIGSFALMLTYANKL